MRRAVRAVGVVLVFVSMSAAPAAHAAGDTFGGYQGSASASGFSAAPSLPSLLPVETPFEGTLSLTLATLSSGGQGFGRASSVWPGTLAAFLRPLLETGGGVSLPIPDYPLVVEQRDFEDAKHSDIPGATMATDVKPEHSLARADFGGTNVPAIVSFGSISSSGEVTLDADKLTSIATAAANGIDVLAGALHIDSVQSRAVASSDSRTATCDGSTTVSGATVGGVPVTIDNTGVHAQGSTVLPGVDPNAVVATVLATSGIDVRTLPDTDNCADANANRTSGGLLIGVPLPSISPIPPGGRLNILLTNTSATAGATPPFDLTGGAKLPASTPSLASVAPHAPGQVFGGGLPSSSVAAPSTPGDAVGAVLPSNEPAAYVFHGVAVGWVLGLLGAGLIGASTIRRYMRRAFTITATTGSE